MAKPAKTVPDVESVARLQSRWTKPAGKADAIRLDTGKHAVPYDSRDQFIHQKDLLLQFTGKGGARKTENPRHEPGDRAHPGLMRDHLH